MSDEKLPLALPTFDLRSAADRNTLASLPGGAALPDKVNIVAATLDVIFRRHDDELRAMPEAWAALKIATEKLAEAEWVIRKNSSNLRLSSGD